MGREDYRDHLSGSDLLHLITASFGACTFTLSFTMEEWKNGPKFLVAALSSNLSLTVTG
jgi:hypothetical protein